MKNCVLWGITWVFIACQTSSSLSTKMKKGHVLIFFFFSTSMNIGVHVMYIARQYAKKFTILRAFGRASVRARSRVCGCACVFFGHARDCVFVCMYIYHPVT